MTGATAERPTDDEMIGLLERYEDSTGDKTSAAMREMLRARSEEARLLKENRTQAETIKALANALLLRGVKLDGRDWHLFCCPVAMAGPVMRPSKSCDGECRSATAALRLATRLT